MECKFVYMYKTIAINLMQLYCKLNRSRLSNVCVSSAITLGPRIGVAPKVLNLHTSIKKTSLFGYISEIQNIFVLLNSFLIRGVID